MSQLNSIIASILSDINEAKSQADAASRDIAKSYAADQILRYFPVPRIRRDLYFFPEIIKSSN